MDQVMYEKELEKQFKDSDIIFTAISTSGARDYQEAERIVIMEYVTDMSFSRAGISHALKRLEKHYNREA